MATMTLRKVCQDAITALESLPEDALGYANDGDKCQWPIRDELVHNLRAAVEEQEQKCVWTIERGYGTPGCIADPNAAEAWQRLYLLARWNVCPYCGREIERKEASDDK